MQKKKTANTDATEALKKTAGDKYNNQYVFRLFVTGMSNRSQEAIENVRDLCEKYITGHYELEVIDIYQHPHSASENQILASPTLIKKLPLPLRRFVGNMTKTEKILAGLDLRIETTHE